MPATQADFFRRLQQETVELVDGTVESRFRTRLTQIRNDVAAASTLINRAAGALPEQSLDHLEAAGRHLGEAVALVHDRKITEQSTGYHYRAIALLRAYCEAHHPAFASDASQFERIRSVRNMIDYPDDHWPAGEGDDLVAGFGASQARLWLTVAERLVAALVPILERAYLQRHPG